MEKEKRGLRKFKIQHNKKLFWIIIFLIVILVLLIYVIKETSREEKEVGETEECERDEDCVAATCCHAEKCVAEEKAPICKGIMCSMVCSGPLDCGAGRCGCVNGECQIIKK